MKTTLTVLTMAGALAFAVPALAQETEPTAPATTPSASKQCKTERTAMGKDAFALLYGTNANRRNAFGRCVSKRHHATEEAAEAAHENASKECKAEAQADPAAFRTTYGTGNGANAHGKCVSKKAKAKTAKAVAAQVDADVEAAKACKAEVKGKKGKARGKAFKACVAEQKSASQS
jgi:hypothetical protein